MTEIGEDSEVSQGGIDLAPDRGQNLADPGKIAFDMKRNLLFCCAGRPLRSRGCQEEAVGAEGSQLNEREKGT